MITAIKQICRDAGDRRKGAADVAANAVGLVHCLQHTVKASVGGIVVVHADLLTDDTDLGGNRFRGKIRMGHKIQKLTERILKAVGTAEEIAGLIKGGIGVGVGAVLGEPLKRVAAVLTGKELVLQKMRDAVRNRQPLRLLRRAESVVNRAVFGSK